MSYSSTEYITSKSESTSRKTNEHEDTAPVHNKRETSEDRYDCFQFFTPFLNRCGSITLTVWSTTAAFFSYYSMYAFRKPYNAATWTDEEHWFDGTVNFKTSLALAQMIGYLISKWVAIIYVPHAIRSGPAKHLLVLILLAEASLILYAILPKHMKPIAMLLNGLPLGCVWSLIVTFVEGRFTSDFMLAVMSISYIIASGNMKDIALLVLQEGKCVYVDGTTVMYYGHPIDCNDHYPCDNYGAACHITSGFADKYWMPAIIGGIFLPISLLMIFLLHQLPPPSLEEKSEKSPRKAMTREEMSYFVRELWPSVVSLWLGFMAWTAYRGYRDTYLVDMYEELGGDLHRGVFSSMESIVALTCLVAVGPMVLMHNNIIGLVWAHSIILAGALVTFVIVIVHWTGSDTSPYLYITTTGIGTYLSHTAYNSVLYERIVSYTEVPASVTFPMSVGDALGYLGTSIFFLFSEFSHQDRFVDTFNHLAFAIATIGVACTMFSLGFYYIRYKRKELELDFNSVIESTTCSSVAEDEHNVI